MRNPKYAVYKGAEPYFNLVRRAVGDIVDGEHFFDIVADNVVYEVLYDIAGWPQTIRGRADLMAQFRGYCDNVELQSADKLITHKTDNGLTVVIEYEVHGTILRTGVKYNNRFCSIIKMENRKVAHWRDYMDSLAAWNALTATPVSRGCGHPVPLASQPAFTARELEPHNGAQRSRFSTTDASLPARRRESGRHRRQISSQSPASRRS
jgi:uncharacterized protein